MKIITKDLSSPQTICVDNPYGQHENTFVDVWGVGEGENDKDVTVTICKNCEMYEIDDEWYYDPHFVTHQSRQAV